MSELWLHPSWTRAFAAIPDHAKNAVNEVAASIEVSDIAILRLDVSLPGPFPKVGTTINKNHFANLVIGGMGDCSGSRYLYETQDFRCDRGLRGPCYAPVRVLGQSHAKLFADVANLITQKNFYLCSGDSGGAAYLAENNGDIKLESGQAVLAGVNDLTWDRDSITQSKVMVGSILTLITPEVADWIQSKTQE